jgi:hypothetical protein
MGKEGEQKEMEKNEEYARRKVRRKRVGVETDGGRG